MKICQICGAQLEDNADICPVCGANVGAAQTAEQPVSQDMQQNMGAPDPGMNPAPDMGGQPEGAPQSQYNIVQDPYTPDQNAYMPGQQPYGMQDSVYGQVPMQQAVAKKKTNVAAIIIIAVVAVAAIGFAVWFFLLRGGNGANSPETVVKEAMDAMADGDAERLYNLFPEAMRSDDEYETVSQMLEMFKTYNIKIENFKITDKQKLSKDEIEDIEEEFELYYDEKVSISEAYYVDYSYTMSMEFLGQKQSEDTDETSTVIKIGSKWYMYE